MHENIRIVCNQLRCKIQRAVQIVAWRYKLMANGQGKSNYSGLTRPEHLSLVDIAYKVLLEAIVNQEFKPGAQISIDNLARQLHMSNTPVREALMRAHGEQLVRQKTNHGFVVADLLTPKDLYHLFDVRHTLEVHALKSADISNEPSQELAELNSLVEQMTHATDGAVYDDYKDYLLLDHQFHRSLVGLSDNPFLVKAWEDLHVHLHLSRLYSGVGLFDRNDSVVEHHDILEALRRRDRNQAAGLLSQHILRVEKRVEGLLEQGA
jgi:DNA-binding GntR family transcriptional regulator